MCSTKCAAVCAVPHKTGKTHAVCKKNRRAFHARSQQFLSEDSAAIAAGATNAYQRAGYAPSGTIRPAFSGPNFFGEPPSTAGLLWNDYSTPVFGELQVIGGILQVAGGVAISMTGIGAIGGVLIVPQQASG